MASHVDFQKSGVSLVDAGGRTKTLTSEINPPPEEKYLIQNI